MRFKPIAEAQGVTLSHPYEGYASFTSSPYTAHLHWSAVDLSTATKFGEEALSPVEGVVERVLRVDVGPGPYEREDHLISIRPRGAARASR